MPIPQRRNPGPLLLSWGAQQPENMEQLLELGIPGEQRLPSNHFGEDASDGPDVDGGGVVSGTKQNLRSPVPERDDLMSVALERNSESTTKAQICNFKDALVLVQEKVLGLQIAVEDAVAVAVGDAFAKLEEEGLNEGWRKGPGVGTLAMGIDELLEIGVKILKDQVKVGLGAAVLVGIDMFDAKETDNVEGLGKHLEEGDLSESGRRNALLVHLKTGLLKGHQLAIRLVFGLVNLAVGTLPYLLQFLVLFHFDFGFLFHFTPTHNNLQMGFLGKHSSLRS